MIDTRPDHPPEFDDDTIEDCLRDALELLDELARFVPLWMLESGPIPGRILALKERAGGAL